MSSDAVKVAPKVYKVILENEKVRVLETNLAKGEKTKMHKHPNNVVIALESFHAKFTSPDGKSEKIRGKAGQVMWMPDQEHATENLGTDSVRAIIVELK